MNKSLIKFLLRTFIYPTSKQDPQLIPGTSSYCCVVRNETILWIRCINVVVMRH